MGGGGLPQEKPDDRKDQTKAAVESLLLRGILGMLNTVSGLSRNHGCEIDTRRVNKKSRFDYIPIRHNLLSIAILSSSSIPGNQLLRSP